MLFNSIEFFLFLPIVFAVYWILNKQGLKVQNLLILVASYVFYGWWDWRFLFLIAFSTVVDFVCANQISKANSKNTSKFFLILSLVVNLGMLGVFKYYNFFITEWVEAWRTVGYDMAGTTINIVLPVGISFYTFQTLSYTIDVYNKKLEPTTDFIAFAAFVSFFPQLVAGPIERASNLLPQLLTKRTFNVSNSIDGLRLILWGLFKKVVIADSLAPIVNTIFDQYESLSGITLLLGATYFAFQIYCDFSGYSDIAIGTSKLFGFELMSNFKFPYFSRGIAEFWRKWHISLSTWFRDYVYIPLGGSRVNKVKSFRNVFIIFLVSGFWHGANFTFLVWGGIHAALFIPSFIWKTNRKYVTSVTAENSLLPSLKEFFQMLSTFLLVTLAWVFFRAESLKHAYNYIASMVKNINQPDISLRIGLIYVFIIVTLDWLMRKNERKVLNITNKYIRYSVYSLLVFVVLFKLKTESEFIYFQF